MKYALRIAAFTGVALMLSACGGGGGDAAAPGADPGPGGDPGPVATTKVTGIAAVGAPMAGATITTLCGDGTDGPTAKTTAMGDYELQMTTACPGPWAVQATGTDATTKHFSLGGEPPSDAPPPAAVHINVTPLTTIVFDAVVLKGFPSGGDLDAAREQWIKTVLAEQQETIDTIMQAINQLRTPGSAELKLADILAKTFDPRPGDPMDDLLEYVQAHRGGVIPAALLERVRKSGGDMASGQPWKTLFRTGTSVTWALSDCQVPGGGTATGTVTLRMEGTDLQVEVASGALDAPFSFIVGPGGRSQFQMTLKGSSPFVQLSASNLGNKAIEVFTNEGVPQVYLSNAGAGATCNLATPVRRDQLVAFHTPARVMSAMPTQGASGTCAASMRGPEYSYAVTPMGDVRFNGASLPANWLEGEHAYYSESLQYNLFSGSGKSFQIELSNWETQQGIQPYVFGGTPYLNCLPM